MIRAECVEQKATDTMRDVWPRVTLPTITLLLFLGCASARPATTVDLANANDTGRGVDARTETERQVLKALPTLPSHEQRTVNGAAVLAEPAYAAASGRLCRGVKLGSPVKRRLACSDGQAWFFVPGVFWDAEAVE